MWLADSRAAGQVVKTQWNRRVPAGLGELPKEFVAMVKFHGVDEDLLVAARRQTLNIWPRDCAVPVQ